MLPPIPHSLAPVTAQQDPVKPRADIPPVTPAQGASAEAAITLDRRHPQEVAERLREEQRRRQRKGYTPQEMAEHQDEEVTPGLEDLPRQGLWVDVEV